MNTRQHRFVLNLFQGMNQTDAYIAAGYNVSKEVANANAYDLLQKPYVSLALETLKAKREAIIVANEVLPSIDLALTRSEKRNILADILRNGKPTTETHYSRKIEGRPGLTATMTKRDIIEAVREDNKMSGDYAPSKHMIAQAVQVNIVHRKKLRGGETP
mgnify:CR=1 FL=1